jgi:hypothetical protein
LVGSAEGSSVGKVDGSVDGSSDGLAVSNDSDAKKSVIGRTMAVDGTGVDGNSVLYGPSVAK